MGRPHLRHFVVASRDEAVTLRPEEGHRRDVALVPGDRAQQQTAGS